MDASTDVLRLNKQLNQAIGQSVENTRVEKVDMENLFNDSPVHNLTKLISQSKYSAIHLADISRILLLYKYGGVYTDSDIILIRKTDYGDKFLTRNGNSAVLNNAVFAYPKSDSFLFAILRYINSKYRGRSYFEVLRLFKDKVNEFCETFCECNPQQMTRDGWINCCDLKIIREFIIREVKAIYKMVKSSTNY